MYLVYDYKKDYLYADKTDIKRISPAKYRQKQTVMKNIMELLNKKEYSSIEDFYQNNNNLQDFIKKHLKKTDLATNEPPLNEEDYAKIIENMKTISSRKKSIDANKVQTTKIDKNEYSSMIIDGEHKDIKNTANLSTYERMQALQRESSATQFHTVDPAKNAENLYKEIQSESKEITALPLQEIDFASLNQDEKELYISALEYELSNHTPIKLNLNEGIIKDEKNNTMKIVKDENGTRVLSQEDGNEKEQNIDQQKKAMQKTLTPNMNTIYSNN